MQKQENLEMELWKSFDKYLKFFHLDQAIRANCIIKDDNKIVVEFEEKNINKVIMTLDKIEFENDCDTFAVANIAKLIKTLDAYTNIYKALGVI